MKVPLSRIGIPKHWIDEMRINDPAWKEKWRQHDTYVCVQCGAPALANPYTNEIMGCLKCGFATIAITQHFVQNPRVSEHAVA